MRVDIDATYTLGPELSGVGVYSRNLIERIHALHPRDVRLCYRSHRYIEGRRDSLAPGAPRALLTRFGCFPRSAVFHGLNQRLPQARHPRSVVTFHDLFVLTGEYSTREFRARFATQAREAAGRADLIIAVSEFTASQVHELLGVPRERLRVIHHAPNRVAVPLEHAEKEPLIFFVGALQKRKNVVRLIEAFENVPPGWKLLLAGGRGYGVEEIEQRIAASPKRDHISVSGYLDPVELERVWARASLLAFPSLDEGFGMPVLDAMARGVPVLTSNRSALPEVAGGAALLVEPEDSHQIAAALTRLCADEALRLDLTQRGLNRVAGMTWESVAQKTWAVYDELAG